MWVSKLAAKRTAWMTKPHTCTNRPDCFGCKVRTLTLRTTAFQPHFNYSVGSYVTTEQQFKDALNRRAEENTIQTGTYHNYEMRDPGELSQTPYPDHDDILNTRARIINDGVPR
jgi:hypothetical protein